ncbi:acyltransferase family protein [Salipiger sp. 1_MG-2023]|uniref:acyltransferase family protein n=1 Tax=Salipiger sp. 1_MG-2023 TaxID=3062665 RepID=UPI0026E2DEC1|nr:acyltransferase family protein [Salipiger sp. 1_MG-2023]MDO6583965.1 acyltransferase family protein [Salipiger sp. 1_MG-2023]
MRNDRIDALRGIAALGIIALHIPHYPEFPADLVAALRGLLRWCVPFFFLLTGYYLTRPGEALPWFSRQRLLRLVLLTALANLLYLPIGLWRYGELMGAGQALFFGTWYHLWYLNGLLMSAMLIEALGRRDRVVLAQGLGLVIALGFAVTSVMLAFGHGSELINATVRQFLGLPCLLAGAALHRVETPRLRPALVVLGLGITLLLGEMAVVHMLGGSWMIVQ